MIACDIDGTLLDYDYIPGQPPKINYALIEQLRGKEIALVTNQGGLPFGVKGAIRKDGRPYPTPEDFIDRLKYLLEALHQSDITVCGIQICIYHPKADPYSIDVAHGCLLDGLDQIDQSKTGTYIYWIEHFRKPNPAMLIEAGATIYYGDSDEDEEAAANARIKFVRVDRFTGV